MSKRSYEPSAPEESLARASGIGPGSCVALVGAGGKTTTMLALGNALQRADLRTLVTTTTKIWPPRGLPLVLEQSVQDIEAALLASFARLRLVALGDHIGGEGKLRAVEPDLLCRLLAAGVCDTILCEADGAAGRSLKAHAAGEPVIPGCTSHVLAVAGVDAVGQRVDESWVHRIDRFCEITGAHVGETITPIHVARALQAVERHVRQGARLIYVLNKVDDPVRRQSAEEIAVALRDHGIGHAVIMARDGLAAGR